MYVIEHYHSRRFWIEGQGWATTNEARATRYSEQDARKLASRLYGEAIESVRNVGARNAHATGERCSAAGAGSEPQSYAR